MNTALRSYEWNLLYAEALVRDLPDEQWTSPGGPGLENHPAWTLGHLCTGANLLAQDLGLPDDLPRGWAELFQRRGPGDPRLPESEDWAFGRDLPSRADVALFMALTHEALHLGQLAAWRRARGFPSALRALAVERSA